MRELRRAPERAHDDDVPPTFPGLFEHDDRGELVVDERGRHKSSVVTRAVYRHEVKCAERTARRRAKMEVRYGSPWERSWER